MSAVQPGRDESLPFRLKAGFALGDHTINVQLSALSLYYLFFLTEVAGLSPSLAGMVLLIGRAVDAFSDPAMGRLSDRMTWKWGRRRPFFLIGALPFGVTFAFLWRAVPADGQMVQFAYFSAIYVLNTLSSTVLNVPYMALLPEMARSYQERTSLNAFRQIAAVLGVLVTALTVQPLTKLLGGGTVGWAQMGIVLSVWIVLPWVLVHRVTFERRGFAVRSEVGLLEGARQVARHATYRRLAGLYIAARIAVDIVGAMFIFFFTYWLKRPEDFPITLGLLMLCGVLVLPVWLQISKRADKHRLFIVGAVWWIGIQGGMLFVGPDDPRWFMFAIAVLSAVGYTVADLMPWAMLGDVIDEDELLSGERREGLYAGFFTFLRKLGGAIGVAAAGFALDLAGFVKDQAQTDSALLAIRLLTAGAPMLFLAIAIVIAAGYPLSRRRHEEILEALERA